jgi:acyl-CoA thioester hydrolase
MRWADLDSLNHVNNVVYLDYAAESRALLVDDGLVDADEPVSCIAIDFLRPLLLTTRPVQVVSSRDGARLTQEIRLQGTDRVFARVVTSFGDRAEISPQDTPRGPLPARVRRSDLDQSGAVSATKLFELFQEARILFIAGGVGDMSPGRFVVGRVEVSLGGAMRWRHKPYDARSWVSRVGGSSVTIESQLADGATVLAQCRSVLVGFDLQTQRSRTLSDVERDDFGALGLSG